MKWNAIAPQCIFSVPTGGNTNRDILTKYKLIFPVNIADAFSARTKNLAIQKPNAFYAMLYKSVTGTIHDTIFKQAQNLPSEKSSVAILKLFTLFTIVTSLQRSILSLDQIMSLLMLKYNYIIPKINTKLAHIFLLARTPT